MAKSQETRENPEGLFCEFAEGRELRLEDLAGARLRRSLNAGLKRG